MMARRHSRSPRQTLGLAVFHALVLLLCAPADGRAQGTTPQRGFQPNGSYALTDLETISMTSGNMTLRVPLASLPAGRGGSPGPSVSLLYNSKLYDSINEIHNDPIEPSNSYTMNVLAPGGGGWQYGYGYQLSQYNRFDEYAGYMPACNSDEAVYHYKVKVRFPDGAEREFRPLNHSQSPWLNDGYYAVDVNGFVTDRNCGGSWGSTTGMAYYSTDGTYMRLEVAHDNDSFWWNNPWTLFMPDGTRVTGGNSNQRVYDRNNNYTEIQHVTLPNGHPATKLVDQLGRSITIEQDAAQSQDYITVAGVGGEAVTTTVRWKTVWVYRNYQATLFAPFGVDPNRDLYTSLYVVDQITTPAQAGSLTYVFAYNASNTQPGSYTAGWGDLTYLKLPTGAVATYQYATDGGVVLWTDVLQDYPTRKDLTYRQEYDGVAPSNQPCAANCTTETWTYGFSSISGTVSAPDGGGTVESFYDTQNDVPWRRGLVFKSVRADGTMVERIWRTSPANTDSNPYVKTEFTSVKDAAGNYVKTAIKDFNYDQNGNVLETREYDWVTYASVPRDGSGKPTGVPGGATLKRVTRNTYYNPTPDATAQTTFHPNAYVFPTTRRLYHVVASAEVSETGGWPPLTRAEFFYDDPSTTGNLTGQKSWDSAKGAYSNPLISANSISISHQYDGYGNRTLSTDARGVQTLFVYGPVGGHSGLYPTESRVADNYPSLRRTTQTQYDFWTGLATRMTDADNSVSTATAYDALGRTTLVKAAEGKAEETRTTTEYSDSLRRVVVRTDLDSAGDGKLVAVEHFDQLGRVRLSRRLENSSTQSPYDETHGVKVQTRYAYSGPNSYWLVSNPYRAGYSYQTGAEGSMGWSRTKSDSGGRTVEARTFNGAGLPAPWGANASSSGAVTTAYDAEFTTVTDQAGKVRRSAVNGLGLLARVDEPDGAGNLGAAASPNQPTYYTYDALGNLTQVVQGTQPRTFAYSSLSRMTSATNPESGAISYTYDANGNLKTKTDARPVTITYEYDELNRSTQVDYSSTAVNPDIRRYYDNPTAGLYGKGRFWYDYAGGDYSTGQTVEHTAVDSYDAIGRPLIKRQHFKAGGVWSAAYQTSRQYNRAGGVVSQTYPSGRTVSYGYDAAGRVAGFTGNLGDSVSRSYSSGMQYDEAGRLAREQFGTATPLHHKRHYNTRGQLFDVRVGYWSDEWNWNRGAIVMYYDAAHSWAGQGGNHATNADNNGNVTRLQSWVPGDDVASTYHLSDQYFEYDSLNRIKSVNEYKEGTGVPRQHVFTQAYQYDRWGNRQIDAGQTWGTNIPEPQFAIDVATNRIGAPGQPGAMTYDNAGNLTNDTYTGWGTRTYDAENRMTSAWGPNIYGGSYLNQYAYDADGRRVRRTMQSGEVWQVYGLDGELLAEYGASVAPTAPRKEYGYRAGELLVTAEADFTWVDDGLPAGAWHCVCGVNEAWNWVGSNPAPVSGSYSDQMAATAGLHQQFFEGATQTMNVGAGETLVAYVYLDPANPPSEIMLQWNAPVGGWEHRAYWGANLIGWGADGTNSRRYMGPLPQAGQWVRLEVPAAAVGLEGQAVHGLAVTLYNGRATWDKLGKGSVRWIVSDHLGTPRITADVTGSLSGVSRHDYLPFGEEIGAGTGGRTEAQGYSQMDNVRQKFTGKERDSETGLDYLINRYYSSALGRFTTADPVLIAPPRLPDPQRLNLYAYVRNNPLVATDPNGLELQVIGDEERAYIESLERTTKLKLKLGKNGMVTIVSKPKQLSKDAKKIADIIESKDKKDFVRITAVSKSDTALVGAFHGGGEQEIDFGDLRMMEAAGRGGATVDSGVMHETIEAIEGRNSPCTINPDMALAQRVHSMGIDAENEVRRQQGLGPRVKGSEKAIAQLPNGDVVISVDFTTHVQIMVVDRGNHNILKKAEVRKK
jgi:RHS repeat-associated protein